VGGRVYRSLEAATRSGWSRTGKSGRISKSRASWTESVPRPVDGDEPAESAEPGSRDLEAKRRVVERLYDDHHVRLLGWGDSLLIIRLCINDQKTILKLLFVLSFEVSLHRL